ncbi:GNAT family N-acetyltransferase [Hymenobacter sp. H14-R3]|uniref:GNAT family N-acetyltransferase n=1 Tax=Hymenobacter sp. H14-R3 TaxID=3046308 RepID=UPI0024BBB797|nr:GNAT family N-acetyltransferase [Hymenobacter sp. H14-R3]MDJ0364468.1 GNAT family N-acetyltransferase [Hymenobacter sp. H14-R3]
MSVALSRLPGDFLDYYLGQGYYRMGQNLFTCEFLPLETGLCTTHWLRLALADVAYGPKQRRLFRLNEQFAITTRPFRFSPELMDLYNLYYQSIDFDGNPSLADLLLDGAAHNVFDTHVIEVRDGPRLIAAGVFDNGTDSIAGIVNFYDPSYHKHSLGKYLMLLKLEHARRHGLAYYYPGYLVHGYPKFDYKLFACPAATEVFNSRTHHWRTFRWEDVNRQAAFLHGERQAQDLADEAQ